MERPHPAEFGVTKTGGGERTRDYAGLTCSVDCGDQGPEVVLQFLCVAPIDVVGPNVDDHSGDVRTRSQVVRDSGGDLSNLSSGHVDCNFPCGVNLSDHGGTYDKDRRRWRGG